MAAPKSKSPDLSALSFAMECIKRGANVAFPFGEHSPYNVIVDAGGKLYRVRAKIAGVEKSTGTLTVNAQKRVPNISGVGSSTFSEPYATSEIDLVAACFLDNWYVFADPGELPANVKMARGSHSLSTNSLERYRNAWHLLGLSQP